MLYPSWTTFLCFKSEGNFFLSFLYGLVLFMSFVIDLTNEDSSSDDEEH